MAAKMSQAEYYAQLNKAKSKIGETRTSVPAPLVKPLSAVPRPQVSTVPIVTTIPKTVSMPLTQEEYYKAQSAALSVKSLAPTIPSEPKIQSPVTPLVKYSAQKTVAEQTESPVGYLYPREKTDNKMIYIIGGGLLLLILFLRK